MRVNTDYPIERFLIRTIMLQTKGVRIMLQTEGVRKNSKINKLYVVSKVASASDTLMRVFMFSNVKCN
jgi:hypothetical protein